MEFTWPSSTKIDMHFWDVNLVWFEVYGDQDEKKKMCVVLVAFIIEAVEPLIYVAHW